MKVLITGATGYIGKFVAEKLLERGDHVIGLARNEARAAVLPKGARPLIGSLEHSDWIGAVADVDAVVHTAFPQHGLAWSDGVAVEAKFLGDLVLALEGSGKAVIASNGTIFLGDSASGRLDETAPVLPQHPAAIRAAATRVVTEGKGIRGVELRLASFVYGHGGSGFLPVLASFAGKTGRALFVGDGSVRTSAVHVEAAAAAFVRALDEAPAGSTFHIASDEEPTIRQIAEAIALGAGQGCKAVSATRDEVASQLDPFTAMFLATNNRLDAGRARRELGWSHAGHTPLLWDVAAGSYAR